MASVQQMAEKPVKLAITANTTWCAGGIALFIESAVPDCPTAQATTVAELENLVRSGWADVIVVGVPNRHPDHDRLVDAVRRDWPDMPVCVVSSDHFPDTVRKAREVGAQAYVTTTSDPSAVQLAIRSAFAGEDFYTEEAEESLADQAPRHLPTDINMRVGKLTRRERQVMDLLGRGYANREIADALDLREGTVRIYVHRVIRQLGLRNRVDVALCANYMAQASA
jgi:DNA-binding NarL/FixJ family response regulator